MTKRVLLAALICAASFVSAEEPAKADCDAQAAMVMEVVTGRSDGVAKGKARRELRKGIEKSAADMLVEWVYSLPEEQLTDQIGTVWKAQCETL